MIKKEDAGTRVIKRIVIHVSDSPDTRDIGVKEIRQWHVEERGWKDVGYNYVVRRSGVVEPGRPLNQIPAHTVGHNSNSIGICWVGRDRPTYDQRQALWELVLDLLDTFELQVSDVYGHKELAPGGKTCPNLDCDVFRNELKIHEPKWRDGND